ncbi:MAG: serine/threonine protein kinase, partial [Planctomycetes bacterium]|nr:serine/threonine protein kinase [Planctomycetota bacterium]
MDPFDIYLDACLAGTAEDPLVFFARHPGLDGETRARIEEMHRRAALRAPPRSLPFERLGEFRLLRRLGAGGMGTVYLARQESLDRDVALKVLRPELQGSREAAERFRREAVAVARLKHGNIVGVHAIGEAEGVQYIALDLVDGRNLDEILAEAAGRGETIPWRDAARWAAGIARALEHAHARGVIHRDVKPSNIRVTPDGKPLLLDFGIARDTAGGTLTATFAGSPLYAAPEQLSGATLDARADVYGLGATLYQCLT